MTSTCPRCHNVTSDNFGKIKFHVPLNTDLPQDVTKLSIKVYSCRAIGLQYNVDRYRPQNTQAKALNRKADNATGMEQPVSNELAQNVEMIFLAGIEARRVPLPQGRVSESWSPEEGEASANMR